MKENKIILPMFVLASMMIMLSGCESDKVDSLKNEDNNWSNKNDLSVGNNTGQNIDQNNIDQKDDSQTNLSDETVVKLVVDGKKCIGCGKCARVAASNFAMQDGHATVISLVNADSSSVKQAIKNCPASAISYEG